MLTIQDFLKRHQKLKVAVKQSCVSIVIANDIFCVLLLLTATTTITPHMYHYLTLLLEFSQPTTL